MRMLAASIVVLAFALVAAAWVLAQDDDTPRPRPVVLFPAR